MPNALEALFVDLRETEHLAAALRLLSWDQETLMPDGGGAARADSIALLGRLLHERTISDRLQELLAAAEAQSDGSSDQKRIFHLVRRETDRARKLPASLVEEIARATALGQQVWQKAREARDFALFLPSLRRIVDLKREEGRCLRPEGGTAYDGLLDQFEPEFRETQWAALFDGLVPPLVELLGRILEVQARRPAVPPELAGPFPAATQEVLCRRVLDAIGFDFQNGRLDVSAHPFTETVHAGDVRITVRYHENELGSALFSAFHEGGHALYEQGIRAEERGTPLGQAVSMGLHESQSRLYENQIGRSRLFWEPRWDWVREAFPALSSVPLEAFLRHANRVAPSLIRVEADEATYNLHIAVRFRLERALFAGDLEPEGLPAAWNEAYRAALGITPAHDGEGVLQDIHWSAGLFGYFPTYTLGNLLAAQIHRAATAAVPAGDLAALREWLRARIHAPGNRQPTAALIQGITGHAPRPDEFLAYLEAKYLAADF